ncbi:MULTISPECIES: YncE family protein [unclassified Nocardioides]|uniref:YncE family protein n=1 Tax=unclassified Nocardioides TaxID=2615069 RepID=UPI003617EF4B
MSILRTAGAAAGLVLALSLAPPVAADGRGDHGGHHGDHHSDHHGGDAGPDQIDLPNGWRPEGITNDGRRLYVGSLADGAIWVADPRTGDGEVLAEGATGRVAVGVTYDWRRDLLWVAGGLTGEVRAQDADTGEVLATYSFPSPDATQRFLNDLTVTRQAVYVTDSRTRSWP